MLPGARFTDPMLCLISDRRSWRDACVAAARRRCAGRRPPRRALRRARLQRSRVLDCLIKSQREPRKVTQFKAWICEEIDATIKQFGPLVCVQ